MRGLLVAALLLITSVQCDRDDATPEPAGEVAPPPRLSEAIGSIRFGWLPSARMGTLAHYVLPTITLSAFLVAGMIRLVRSSVLEVLDSEFVKLARIKGLSQTVVIWKHCLRNALIPVVTLFGVLFALLVTGAIVTETVFAWPGVGRLTYEAVIFRDYPLLQAVILMKAIIVLGVNLCVDILYAYLDPRVRYA